MLAYHLLDVFTDTPFTGNPLAVLVDPGAPGELDDGQLQRIARELNLSETVFVWRPAGDGPWPTRIFTPAAELPFAGHPTIGTAVLLAAIGEATGAVVLAEGVGDVHVELGEGAATLTAARPPEETPVDGRDVLAAAIGLTTDDLHPDLAPRGMSAGVAFTVIPVSDAATLARCRPDTRRSDLLYPVTPLDADRRRWRVRLFAPSLGIAEDPATGAAAAAFAGYLMDIDGDGAWDLEQGVEMGRPSRLHVEGRRDGPVVRVGGSAVVVGEGRLRVPPAGDG